MKKDIAEKWVAALRSGNYIQGDDQMLKSSQGYCCLGVLCEIVSPKPDDYLYQGDQYVDPDHRILTGLKYSNGRLPTQIDGVDNLAFLNDGLGNSKKRYSFLQLADIIEQNWEQL